MSRSKKPALSATVAPEVQQQDVPPALPAPAPNIILSAGSEPVTEGDLGWRAIVLPSKEVQRAGWYEPLAAEVLKLYGGIYKVPVKKG